MDVKGEKNLLIFTRLNKQVLRHVAPTSKSNELGQPLTTKIIIIKAPSRPNAITGNDQPIITQEQRADQQSSNLKGLPQRQAAVQ